MKILTALLALSAVVLPAAAPAAVVVLDFENIAPYPGDNDTLVGNAYGGGVSSAGLAGTNYGVTFSSNAIVLCLNTDGVACSNTSRGGLGNPSSARGSLFFTDGASTGFNVAGGFQDGLALNYVGNGAGVVSIYDGLNGTGTLLASFNLPSNYDGVGCPTYGAGFCPFTEAGATFAGTAQSVQFAGAANQIVFDDVTLGASSVPGTVAAAPEASTWSMMIAGFGIAGGAVRRRRTTAHAVTA